jgi:hypothetical protein
MKINANFEKTYNFVTPAFLVEPINLKFWLSAISKLRKIETHSSLPITFSESDSGFVDFSTKDLKEVEQDRSLYYKLFIKK